jgi:hypothetical protein
VCARLLVVCESTDIPADAVEGLDLPRRVVGGDEQLEGLPGLAGRLGWLSLAIECDSEAQVQVGLPAVVAELSGQFQVMAVVGVRVVVAASSAVARARSLKSA